MTPRTNKQSYSVVDARAIALAKLKDVRFVLAHTTDPTVGLANMVDQIDEMIERLWAIVR